MPDRSHPLRISTNSFCLITCPLHFVSFAAKLGRFQSDHCTDPPRPLPHFRDPLHVTSAGGLGLLARLRHLLWITAIVGNLQSANGLDAPYALHDVSNQLLIDTGSFRLLTCLLHLLGVAPMRSDL